jgi:hypothetical protein
MAMHEKITVTNIFYKEKVVTVIFKNTKKRVLKSLAQMAFLTFLAEEW